MASLGRGSAGLAAGMMGPGIYGGAVRGGSGGSRSISGILNMGHPHEGHASVQGAEVPTFTGFWRGVRYRSADTMQFLERDSIYRYILLINVHMTVYISRIRTEPSPKNTSCIYSGIIPICIEPRFKNHIAPSIRRALGLMVLGFSRKTLNPSLRHPPFGQTL